MSRLAKASPDTPGPVFGQPGLHWSISAFRTASLILNYKMLCRELAAWTGCREKRSAAAGKPETIAWRRIAIAENWKPRGAMIDGGCSWWEHWARAFPRRSSRPRAGQLNRHKRRGPQIFSKAPRARHLQESGGTLRPETIFAESAAAPRKKSSMVYWHSMKSRPKGTLPSTGLWPPLIWGRVRASALCGAVPSRNVRAGALAFAKSPRLITSHSQRQPTKGLVCAIGSGSSAPPTFRVGRIFAFVQGLFPSQPRRSILYAIGLLKNLFTGAETRIGRITALLGVGKPSLKSARHVAIRPSWVMPTTLHAAPKEFSVFEAVRIAFRNGVSIGLPHQP